MANAAGSLMGFTDGPVDGGGSESVALNANDGRPERVQFEGLPGTAIFPLVRFRGLEELQLTRSVGLVALSLFRARRGGASFCVPGGGFCLSSSDSGAARRSRGKAARNAIMFFSSGMQMVL